MKGGGKICDMYICTKDMRRSVTKNEWIESRWKVLSMYNRKSGKGERRQ